MTSSSSIRVGALALPLLVPRLVLVGDAPAPYGSALTSADAVWALFANDAPTWDRERVLTLALDTRKHLIGVETVSVGTLTEALVHPREIFKALILANAQSFICLHNHPCGDPTPSAEDYAMTRRLKEAGALLCIPLLDHIILGHTTFHSFQAEGKI
jgi:DNA repair protein RadC